MKTSVGCLQSWSERFQALSLSFLVSQSSFSRAMDGMDHFCEQVEEVACFPALLANWKTAAVMTSVDGQATPSAMAPQQGPGHSWAVRHRRVCYCVASCTSNWKKQHFALSVTQSEQGYMEKSWRWESTGTLSRYLPQAVVKNQWLSKTDHWRAPELMEEFCPSHCFALQSQPQSQQGDFTETA